MQVATSTVARLWAGGGGGGSAGLWFWGTWPFSVFLHHLS